MADWNNPTTSSNYSTGVLQVLKDRDFDAISLCLSDPTNMVDGMIKLVRSPWKLQERSSGAWVDRIIDVVGGGTGSATAGGARTNLGLGSMAVQNSSAVSISGGVLAGDGSGLLNLAAANITSGGTLPALDGSNLTNLVASALATGTVAPARLGSGSGGATKYLREDSTWQSITVFKSLQHIATTVDTSSGSANSGFAGFQDITITALTDYTKAYIVNKTMLGTQGAPSRVGFQLTSNTNLRVYFTNNASSDPSFPVMVDIVELSF